MFAGMASLSTYQSPLELYEHAVGLGGSPNSFLGYAIHAVIHDKQGPPEVHASARKAVENYPLLAPAHHALGMCEESRGLPFKALDAFETALDLLGGQKGFPAPEDWHSLGNEALMYLTAKARALCGLKRYEDARDIYLALESAGKLQELWAAKVCLGKALWEVKRSQIPSWKPVWIMLLLHSTTLLCCFRVQFIPCLIISHFHYNCHLLLVIKWRTMHVSMFGKEP